MSYLRQTEVSVIVDSSQRSNGSNEDFEVFLTPGIDNYDYFYVRSADIPDQGFYFTANQTVAYNYNGMTPTRVFGLGFYYTWQHIQEQIQTDLDSLLGPANAQIRFDMVDNFWYLSWLSPTTFPLTVSFVAAPQLGANTGFGTGIYTGTNYAGGFNAVGLPPLSYYIISNNLAASLPYTNQTLANVIEKVPYNSGLNGKTVFSPNIPNRVMVPGKNLTKIQLRLQNSNGNTVSLNTRKWLVELVFVNLGYK